MFVVYCLWWVCGFDLVVCLVVCFAVLGFCSGAAFCGFCVGLTVVVLVAVVVGACLLFVY